MKLLTPEEIAKLKESPYVVEATERYVYFNIEFKKKYYRAYQRGVKPTQILIDLGYFAHLQYQDACSKTGQGRPIYRQER